MTRTTQIIGETLTYQQTVINDTIESAAWSVDQTEPVIVPIDPSTTVASTTFACTVAGSYVLTVALTLTSGQIKYGQIRIDVIAVGV